MSGFVGLVGPGASLARMRRHLRALDARGPTASWELAGPGFAFGAVASGATGAGARVAQTEGWVVALDGELPNAESLQREMGWPSDGAADTVARLLASTGIARTLSRMAGDVGVVAVELGSGRVFASRGPVGLRPLHFVMTEGDIVVSTGTRSLQRQLGSGVSGAAESQMITLGCVVPPLSAWDGVGALGPGTWAEWGPDGFREFRWANLERAVGAGQGNHERFVRSVHYVFDGAVRGSVQAAGPWALGLSAGAASAALLACSPPTSRPTVAFTLEGVEAAAGRARAAAANVPWKSVRLSVDDVDALLEEAPEEAPILTVEGLIWHALARATWQEGLAGLALGVGAEMAFDPVQPPSALRTVAQRFRGGGAPTEQAALQAATEYSAMAGDESSSGWGAYLALAAAAPNDDRPGFLADRLWFPERRLRAVEQACAAWGIAPALPFADPAVLRVGRIVPASVHHAHGRRCVLRGVVTAAGGLPANDPPEAPTAPAREWLLRGNELEQCCEFGSATLGEAHLRSLAMGVHAGDSRSVRRMWAIAMLGRWRAAIRAAG